MSEGSKCFPHWVNVRTNRACIIRNVDVQSSEQSLLQYQLTLQRNTWTFFWDGFKAHNTLIPIWVCHPSASFQRTTQILRSATYHPTSLTSPDFQTTEKERKDIVFISPSWQRHTHHMRQFVSHSLSRRLLVAGIQPIFFPYQNSLWISNKPPVLHGSSFVR